MTNIKQNLKFLFGYFQIEINMGMSLEILVPGGCRSYHPEGYDDCPEYIKSDTKFIYNLIRRMGLYDDLYQEQKDRMDNTWYQDIGFIKCRSLWFNSDPGKWMNVTTEEDLHSLLKPYKEEYEEIDRYDEIINFFMYVIKHKLSIFAG